MPKMIVASVRWTFFAVGVILGVAGALDPSMAHGTNFGCWLCMFGMCAPYPEKKEEGGDAS